MKIFYSLYLSNTDVTWYMRAQVCSGGEQLSFFSTQKDSKHGM